MASWVLAKVKDGAKSVAKVAIQLVYGGSSEVHFPANAQRINVQHRIAGYVISSTIHGWFEGFLYGRPGIFVWHKLGALPQKIEFFAYDDGKYSVSLPLTSTEEPKETLNNLAGIHSVEARCSTMTVDKLKWICIRGWNNTSGSTDVHQSITQSTTEGAENRSDHRQTVHGNAQIPYVRAGGHGSASHSTENRQHEATTRRQREAVNVPAGASRYEWQLGVEDLDEAGQVTYILVDLFHYAQDETGPSLPGNLESVQDLLRKRIKETVQGP